MTTREPAHNASKEAIWKILWTALLLAAAVFASYALYHEFVWIPQLPMELQTEPLPHNAQFVQVSVNRVSKNFKRHVSLREPQALHLATAYIEQYGDKNSIPTVFDAMPNGSPRVLLVKVTASPEK